MRLLSALRYPAWSLKRKLFLYMLLLVLLLLLSLTAGLFLFGRFLTTEDDTYGALDVQMKVFEKDVLSHFDNLSAASIDLSTDMSRQIENYLCANSITMAAMTDSPDHINALQEAMIGTLQNKLLQKACSGIFVMMDATINSALEQADRSRAGLYLQINGYGTAGDDTLLYRGSAEIAKEHGIMPHRKWHLEFRTDLFPNYDQIRSLASQPAHAAYYVTDLFTLPGTSEKVMLLAVPMVGSDGTYYGICGYEISASFFTTYHAQPSNLPHLLCLLCPAGTDTLLSAEGFSCGVSNGYYRAPAGSLTIEDADGALLLFSDSTVSYIGVMETVSLSPNNEPYHLTAMLLKSDYDQDVQKNIVQNTILWLLVLLAAVSCCLFFSHRFLTPILKGLAQLKTDEREDTRIPEINDLFLFLSEKDQQHEAAINSLLQESQAARKEKERLMKEVEQARIRYETAQTNLSRISYRVQQEIGPEDYQFFLNGLHDLTATERKIFNLYFEGKSAKEIQDLLCIKENTLKFHNKGIYSKLGVSSRKQLLQYASLMQQRAEEPFPPAKS